MEQKATFFRIVELMLTGTKAELSEQEALELDSLLETKELREIYSDMNNGREIARRLKQLERYAGPACEAAFADFKKQVRRTDGRTEQAHPPLPVGRRRRHSAAPDNRSRTAPDRPERPFVIQTGDSLDIRVLGTKFNVQTYGDIPKTAVTLIEGSVSVGLGSEVGVVLKPAEQAVFDRRSNLLSVRPLEDTFHSVAWSNGYFDFEATPLCQILKELEKWYNIEINTDSIDPDELGLFSLHMSRRTTIAPILNMLHEITGLNFRTTGRTVHLFY